MLRSGRNYTKRRAGCDSQGGEAQKNLEQATHIFQPLSVFTSPKSLNELLKKTASLGLISLNALSLLPLAQN